METSGMESIQDYCRVCTAKTKFKATKRDDGIRINSHLKILLEKYLQIKISENDLLPKVICKLCFDKVEAIDFLRAIAQRTQACMRDLLQNTEAQLHLPNKFLNEYKSFAIAKATQRQQAQSDEVVVNVSLSDPLTKDYNKKLLVAQKKKESLDKAFTPSQINRNAVTSSPIVPPLTIIHQMPIKKCKPDPSLTEKRKKVHMDMTNTTTVTLENQRPVPVARTVKILPRPKMPPPAKPLRPISEAPAMPQKVEIHPVITEHTQALGQNITLGSIIKDEDLLKLILKALKWPVNNQTLGIQIQRLKNTNFSDVIVDPNLLQDADLIQILGPLIHPTLVPTTAMPQLQTFHITIPQEPVAIPPSTISYKLPAETSVQIITVPPEESKPSKSSQKPPGDVMIRKKRRLKPVALRPSTQMQTIVVSDDSEDESLKELTASEEVQRFEVHLDPALYPGVGENSNSNETMLATLNRQREAMMRMHRSKRKQTLLASNVEMVDDIMIVDEGVQMNESYPEVVLVKKPRKTHIMAPSSSNQFAMTEPPKKTYEQPPPPPSSIPVHEAKTLQTVQKMSVKKSSQILSKPITKESGTALTKLQRVVNNVPPPSKILPSNVNNTTLADADSTTRIVINESKAPKVNTVSADIEDQIVKVRIGKQVQKPSPAQTADPSPNNKDVVIFVEYDNTRSEEEAKVAEKPRKEVSTVEAKEVSSINKTKDEEELPVNSPESSKGDVVVDLNSRKEEQSSSLPTRASPVKEQSETTSFELPAIEIKEEDEPDIDTKKDITELVKEEKTAENDDKKEDRESPRVSSRSFVASRTSKNVDKCRLTRSSQKRKVEVKKESPKAVITTFRPARRSKTLSKYYKGPPTPGSSKRSMRSRS